MIVLDTHALIWFLDDPGLLSPAARTAIQTAAEESALYYSQISLWEIAMLARRGRIQFTRAWTDWVRDVENASFLNAVGLSAAIVSRSVQLPARFHGDPADRLIVATALELGCSLATKDRLIRRAKVVPTLW